MFDTFEIPKQDFANRHGAKFAAKAARAAAQAGDAELAGQIAECCFQLGMPCNSAWGAHSPYAIALRLGYARAAKAFLDAGFAKLPPEALLESLRAAIESGDPECVELAFERAAKLSRHAAFEEHALNALDAAASKNDSALVRKLLGMGAPVDPPNPERGSGRKVPDRSAFMAATLSGQLECARVLAQAGADVDFLARGGSDSDIGPMLGWSCVAACLKKGLFEPFKQTIALGAGLTPPSVPFRAGMRYVENPLVGMADERAALSGDDRFLALLCEAGAAFNLSRPKSAAYARLHAMTLERAQLEKSAKKAARSAKAGPAKGRRRL